MCTCLGWQNERMTRKIHLTWRLTGVSIGESEHWREGPSWLSAGLSRSRRSSRGGRTSDKPLGKKPHKARVHWAGWNGVSPSQSQRRCWVLWVGRMEKQRSSTQTHTPPGGGTKSEGSNPLQDKVGIWLDHRTWSWTWSEHLPAFFKLVWGADGSFDEEPVNQDLGKLIGYSKVRIWHWLTAAGRWCSDWMKQLK